MELWKSLLIIFNDETVFAPILALIGASLIVLKESEEDKRASLLLMTFFIGLLLSLTLVSVIADWLESKFKVLSKLRPFEYFAMAYFGDSIFDGVQNFIKFLSSKETRKKVFNAILNWGIETLLKIKTKDE